MEARLRRTSRRVALRAPSQPAPTPRLQTLRQLADWLPGQPWASYSLELPITRRFWQTVLERPFSARSQLVAPDLRAVLRAVELGIGVSLLPTFVCNEPLAEGRVVEPFAVADLVEEEPWFACTRVGEARRPAVKTLLAALGDRPASSPPSSDKPKTPRRAASGPARPHRAP